MYHQLFPMSSCILLALSSFYDVLQMPNMLLLSVGIGFSPSLLMESTPARPSPPLRSIARWYVLLATAVVCITYASSLFISWPEAVPHSDTRKAVKAMSVLTPWTDRIMRIFPVFYPAMWIGFTCGALISRLYLLDVANSRRSSTIHPPNTDSRPSYLQANDPAALPSTEDLGPTIDVSASSIRLLSVPDLFTTGAVKSLVHPPWYSGIAYLCLALMLNFAMPAVVSFSPLMAWLQVSAAPNR